MRLEWLPVAESTLNSQLEYIAQYSIQAARNVAAQIENQTGQLVQFPELGRVGRRRGTRELVISRTSLVVVYRVRPKLARIEIIRVLHTSRQWPPEKVE
ncbi:Toxin ParE1/3/4 OS=Castellaniella defragrans OX=75697 GN=HNR28_000044 PE=3 SV=1 [Castellaniella defragrans]